MPSSLGSAGAPRGDQHLCSATDARRPEDAGVDQRGAESVNLAQHVGHTVTVTGTKAPENQPEKEAGKAEPGAPAEAGKAVMTNLQLTDIKMVSETSKTNSK